MEVSGAVKEPKEKSEKELIAEKTTDEKGEMENGELSEKKKEKKLKKLLEKEKKLAKKAERENLKNEAAKILEKVCENINIDNYGFLNIFHVEKEKITLYDLEELYNKLHGKKTEKGNEKCDIKREDVTNETAVNEINSNEGINSLLNQNLWVRGRIHDIRGKGSLTFIILRHRMYSLQCVLDVKVTNDKNMIKWTNNLPQECLVDIYGQLIKPEVPIESTNIKYEIKINKIFCISKTTKEMPFLLKDANLKETDEETTIKVNQDNRLNNRCVDLRTFSNFCIFYLQSQICQIFRNYLLSHNFMEIHTPKLLGESSEGGANVFQLNYFQQPAFLAQSPQLYKQICINAGFDRVFEIGPVFRAENSNTHRHLCEYVSLDIEMTYKYDYMENVYFYDSLFKHIFQELSSCAKNRNYVNTIKNQYASEDFLWLDKTPIFTYKEAIQILIEHKKLNLKEEEILNYDLTTDMEKELGKIIRNTHNTHYYIIINFPTSLRPFYTMHNENNPQISNSYDFFMRGEEILSGSQRVNDIELLKKNIKAQNLDVQKMSFYVDSFAYSSYPHSGCGIGLERVLMLFLGLNNIRKTSLFPRDPKRLTP